MRFYVLTVVYMNITLVLDMTPCSMVESCQSFAGTYFVHLHGRKGSYFGGYCWFYLKDRGVSSILKMETAIPPKRWQFYSRSHAIMSQNIMITEIYSPLSITYYRLV
jgi:hypothetical protein